MKIRTGLAAVARPFAAVARPLLAVSWVAVLAAGCVNDSSTDVTLSLEAEATSYDIGDAVGIGFTLTNTGRSAVEVTTFAHGSLRIVALTRDGATLAASIHPAHFEDALGSILLGTLRRLEPGESADGRIVSAVVGSPAINVLSVVTLGANGEPESHDFSLSAGSYELTLVYEYAGIVERGRPIHEPETNAATAAFDITGP